MSPMPTYTRAHSPDTSLPLNWPTKVFQLSSIERWCGEDSGCGSEGYRWRHPCRFSANCCRFQCQQVAVGEALVTAFTVVVDQEVDEGTTRVSFAAGSDDSRIPP
jgi:hypothetical protein